MNEGGPHYLTQISQLLGRLGIVYSTVQCTVQYTEQCTVHCTAKCSLHVCGNFLCSQMSKITVTYRSRPPEVDY